jgi:hypothetical protein
MHRKAPVLIDQLLKGEAFVFKEKGVSIGIVWGISNNSSSFLL